MSRTLCFKDAHMNKVVALTVDEAPKDHLVLAK